MKNTRVWLLIALLGAASCINAQWAVYHDPTTPRAKDGKPNLAAPAPRVNGKSDLSGIWQVESSPVKEVQQFLLPGGINGLGEDVPNKYFFNFFGDFAFGKEPFQPAAAVAYQKQSQGEGKPPTLCPLPTLPIEMTAPVPFKIVQTGRVMIFLYEADTIFRQVFTDGRKLPADPQPSWLGYSVGRWEGDAFIAETVGFNDKSTLDALGHPHSEALRLTERFRRRDFGHAEVQITADDPKTYVTPVTIRVGLRLLPDTELIETFCSEGERDLAHMPGK